MSSKELYIIGLGNSQSVDLAQPLSSMEIADGEFTNSRHNIGKSVVEAAAARFGFPPLRIDETTVQQDIPGGGEMRDQLWVATTSGEITSTNGATTELTLAYPGPHINASWEALEPWVIEKNIDPSKMVVIVDDKTLPVGAFDVTLVGPRGHNGYAMIGENYCGLIPVLRVGVDEPQNRQEWITQPWDFNDAVAKRGTNALQDVVEKLQDHRRDHPIISLAIPKDPKYSDTVVKSVDHWQSRTDQDRRDLLELSNTVGLNMVSEPLFLPETVFTQEIQGSVNQLDQLYTILLQQYKAGDPIVVEMLDGNLPEPISDTVKELYHFQQIPEQPGYISMGVDNCYDIALTPTGARLIEGDRNGGGRGDALLLSEYFLNQERPGLGTELLEERIEKMHAIIEKQYKEYCEAKGISAKEKPTLVILSDQKAWDEFGQKSLDDIAEEKSLVEMLGRKFDIVYRSEHHLQVDEDAVKVTDWDGEEKEVDILWHETSPSRMDLAYYEPVARAILDRKANVFMLGDPAKDLLYLNKAILPVLRDKVSMDLLFNHSIHDGISHLSQEVQDTVLTLEQERRLFGAIKDGFFPTDITPDIQAAVQRYNAHQRILKLTGQVRKILPFQVQMTSDTVDDQGDLIGKFFIKTHPFDSFGGRGTAAPSQADRARRMTREIRDNEDIRGVAVAPLDRLQHPLFPGCAVELRIWQFNEPKQKGGDTDKRNKKIRAKYDKYNYLVRVNPPSGEKVSFSDGGGATTAIFLH